MLPSSMRARFVLGAAGVPSSSSTFRFKDRNNLTPDKANALDPSLRCKDGRSLLLRNDDLPVLLENAFLATLATLIAWVTATAFHLATAASLTSAGLLVYAVG